MKTFGNPENILLQLSMSAMSFFQRGSTLSQTFNAKGINQHFGGWKSRAKNLSSIFSFLVFWVLPIPLWWRRLRRFWARALDGSNNWHVRLACFSSTMKLSSALSLFMNSPAARRDRWPLTVILDQRKINKISFISALRYRARTLDLF